jgi:hypothetical protein
MIKIFKTITLTTAFSYKERTWIRALLRRIFGYKMEEVIQGWIKLHNKEFINGAFYQTVLLL